MGWVTFPPIFVFLGRFVLDLSANTCQMRHVTLRPSPLTLEVTALVADMGLHAPSVYQVWTSYAFPFGRYLAFTVWVLIRLVNFEPQNSTTYSIFQGHSLYQVWTLWDHLSYAADKQTDRQTNRLTLKILPTPTDRVSVGNKQQSHTANMIFDRWHLKDYIHPLWPTNIDEWLLFD